MSTHHTLTTCAWSRRVRGLGGGLRGLLTLLALTACHPTQPQARPEASPAAVGPGEIPVHVEDASASSAQPGPGAAALKALGQRAVASATVGALDAHRAQRAREDRQAALAFVDTHDVRDLVPRDEGVLLATAGGLVQVHTGEVTQRWVVADGLRSHDVVSLFAGEGEVWVAFGDGGCQRLDHSGALASCPAVLDAHEIRDWARRGQLLYAVTWRGAVLTVGSDQAAVTLLPEGSLPFATRLMACGDRLVLGSQGSGLAQVDAAGNLTHSAEPRVVTDLACVEGMPFAGAADGLWQGASGTWQRVALKGEGRRRVGALVERGSGLAIAFQDGRVTAWDPDLPERLEELTRLTSTPSTVLADEGGLWVGTVGQLIRLETGGVLGTVALPGPGDVDVAAIAAFDDQVALGFFRGGVAVLEGGAWRRFTRHEGLPSSEVNALAYDSTGTLWVATSRGLARWFDGALDAPVPRSSLPCLHINAVYPVDGQLLLATSCGLGVVNTQTLKVTQWWDTQAGLPHRIVYAVTVWNGQIVAGTNDGLAFRPLSETDAPWSVVRARPGGLSDNWITAVSATETHLWVGTYSGGLYRGPEPAALEPVDAVRYVNLNAVFSDAGEVWVGGLSEGAARLSGGQATTRLDRPGLPGRDVTGFVRSGGAVIVATRSGAWPLPVSKP